MKLEKLEYLESKKGDIFMLLYNKKNSSLGRIAGFYPEYKMLSVDMQSGPNPADWYNRRLESYELSRMVVFQGDAGELKIMVGEKAYDTLVGKEWKKEHPKTKKTRKEARAKPEVDPYLAGIMKKVSEIE